MAWLAGKYENIDEPNPEDIEFVVEYCVGCESHGWNTRHNEAKYYEFAI